MYPDDGVPTGSALPLIMLSHPYKVTTLEVDAMGICCPCAVLANSLLGTAVVYSHLYSSELCSEVVGAAEPLRKPLAWLKPHLTIHPHLPVSLDGCCADSDPRRRTPDEHHKQDESPTPQPMTSGHGPPTLHVPRRAARVHVSSAEPTTVFEFLGRLRDGP